MIINKCGECNISIQLEYPIQEDELYNFPYEYTTTITLIYTVNSSELETLVSTNIKNHKESSNFQTDIIDYQFKQDGLYKILSVIVPNKKWVDDYYIEHNQHPYDIYDKVLIYDDNTLYEYSSEGYKEIDLTFLNEFNQENLNLTINKTYSYTFSKCNLQKCFYEINKELFSKLCGKCNKENEFSIYKRDLLWMAFNIIDYLLEKGLLLKAQYILEQFTSCAGFCNQSNEVKGGAGCGCHSNN